MNHSRGAGNQQVCQSVFDTRVPSSFYASLGVNLFSSGQDLIASLTLGSKLISPHNPQIDLSSFQFSPMAGCYWPVLAEHNFLEATIKR